MSDGFLHKQSADVKIVRMKWLVPPKKSVMDAKQMQVWMEDKSTYILDSEFVQEHYKGFKIKHFRATP